MANDTLDLKISIEQPAAWSRRLTITVPASRVEQERKAAVQRLAKKARIPGFRQGKVPAAVMEKRWGPAIQQDAIEKLVGEAYREAIAREGLQPITQGSIDRIDYSDGSDLTFDVAVEIRPELDLQRLGGFEVERDHPTIGTQQLDEVLDRLRGEQAVWRPLTPEETPLNGDLATVEITPRDDATEAEPGKARRYEIVLGEGQAVPAIEDAIRTLRPGESNEFTVSLPENAEDSASPLKAHKIFIEMVEAKRPELPTLDDEFAKALGDFGSLDVLRERVRTDLEAEAERESERSVRARLIGAIAEANPFEVPDSMIDRYVEQMMPPREGADPQRVAELQQQARPMAAQALKRMLIVERVAELESLRATPDEVDARVANIAERLGRAVAEVRAQLQKSGRLAEIEDEVTEEKVFGYLKSLSTIK